MDLDKYYLVYFHLYITLGYGKDVVLDYSRKLSYTYS